MNNIKWGKKEILKRREKMNHLKQDNNLLIIEIKKLYCIYEEIKKEQKNEQAILSNKNEIEN